MAQASAKFPRRYTQRQALRIQSTTLSSDLRTQDVRQRYRPRITRKRSAGIDEDSDSPRESDKDSNSTRESNKDSDSMRESDSDIDIDEENEQDSGYASDADVEAEYLNGLVEKFRDMGPQISNLGDVALKMAQKEKSLWQK